jgi:N-acetylmuramoyl-L-alanine amidase
MPWNWVAWHASDGNGDGNYDSIAIETCQIGNFAATVRNLANLIARLMREFAIPLDHVVQHNH